MQAIPDRPAFPVAETERLVLREARLSDGGASLHNWSRKHNRAELDYEVSRAHWRQGIASEAVRAVLRFAFEERRLHRVEAFQTMANVASVRLLERLGFVREGTARDVLLMEDGLSHSVGQYSMLEHEYRAEPQ